MPNQELIKKLKIRNPELNQIELKTVFNIFFDTIVKALYNGKNVEIKYRDVHSRTLTNDVQYFPPKARVY